MNYKNRISSIYHPTSVLLIDDNSLFINEISNKLNRLNKNIHCLTYTDPRQALEKIRQLNQIKKYLEKTIQTDTHSEIYGFGAKQHPITINISGLYDFIHDETIFDEISVVVVDFSMPNMDGAEFCRQLKLINSSVKIIMLTGEVDNSIAVDLFNAGMIDNFILKHNPNMKEELSTRITEMQQIYFQDLTEQMINGLATDKISCLRDPFYIEFFYKICNEFSVYSYYLIDTSGSFLFFDDHGLATWFIIKTEDEIVELIKVIIDANNIPKSIINDIRGMRKIPFFKNTDDYINFMNSRDHLEINNYLYNAEILIGERKYGYTIIKDNLSLKLDDKKIIFLDKHIKNTKLS